MCVRESIFSPYYTISALCIRVYKSNKHFYSDAHFSHSFIKRKTSHSTEIHSLVSYSPKREAKRRNRKIIKVFENRQKVRIYLVKSIGAYSVLKENSTRVE